MAIELILMAIKTNKAVKISQKHLLGIQDLSINDVNLILDESQNFIKLNQSKNKRLNVLTGKTQINLFFEQLILAIMQLYSYRVGFNGN